MSPYLLVAAIPLLAGLGMLARGCAIVRRVHREKGLVAVEAEVLEHTFLVDPRRVVWGFRAPSGQSMEVEQALRVPVVQADDVPVAPGYRMDV